jgi:hypothetical protein
MAKNKPNFNPSSEISEPASNETVSPTVIADASAAVDSNSNLNSATAEGAQPANADASAQAAASTEKGPDKRRIMIKDPATGQQIPRVQFIRDQVGAGKSRSEVTQMVRDITGDKDFRYQIVFQATKDMQNITPSQRKGGRPAAEANPTNGAAGAAPASGSASTPSTAPGSDAASANHEQAESAGASPVQSMVNAADQPDQTGTIAQGTESPAPQL